jgi:SP family general alpha glucoside:H+ symporter-like MFS transporter
MSLKGYISQITSFYGQTQFLEKFGTLDSATGKMLISPAWQSGLSNSALVGQLAGLIVNGYCQDRFGCRRTMMFFMAWMCGAIFITFFAPSLSVLAFGEAMCGIPWGVFQVRYAMLAAQRTT